MVYFKVSPSANLSSCISTLQTVKGAMTCVSADLIPSHPPRGPQAGLPLLVLLSSHTEAELTHVPLSKPTKYIAPKVNQAPESNFRAIIHV